jgi:aldehyde:ferredoxin oxidoreductase
MMEFLYNGSILVVDLAAGSAEEVPFPDGFIAGYLGGARANLALLDLYPEADLVLGSGPFTALPVPGACLGVATLKDGDRITHTPLHLFAGMELKLSGFDFVVLQGTAPDPVYLWLHDGIADISPASSLPRDNWEAVDSLRRELGEDLVQVLLAGTGPCLNLGYWAGTDRVGLGRAFSNKGLRAVCARGLGILDAADPEAFAETCASLVGEVRDSLPAGRHGLEGIVSLLEGRECDYPASLMHRRRACFACPYDCNIYLKTEEDPSSMAQDGVDEPGMLLTDARALALMEEKGLPPADGVRLLRRAARLGAYPCGSVAAGPDASDSDLAACAPAPWEGEESPFSPWAPTRTLNEGGDWRERQALAYTMGICPVLMLLSPVLTPEVFAGLLGQGMELEVSPDEVVRICLEA